MSAMETGMMVVFIKVRLAGKNKIFMVAAIHRN